jgi:chemotaxis protein MotB
LSPDTSLPGQDESAFSQPSSPAATASATDAKPEAQAELPKADLSAASKGSAEEAPDQKNKPPGDVAKREEATELQKEIQQQLSGVAGKLAEGIVVQPAEGGMLVTISDQANAAMFNVGSAVPNKELVLAMERIGKVLAERQGSVIIRGHTDGRPYKGRSGDNWGLSMSRAHAAYYMLLRGGLKEDRVKQVSGFADRRLQVPNDPLSDANRRIEILLDQG